MSAEPAPAGNGRASVPNPETSHKCLKLQRSAAMGVPRVRVLYSARVRSTHGKLQGRSAPSPGLLPPPRAIRRHADLADGPSAALDLMFLPVLRRVRRRNVKSKAALES